MIEEDYVACVGLLIALNLRLVSVSEYYCMLDA